MPEFKTEIGNRKLVVKAEGLAEQANGEVLVQYGDTLVLATCCMSSEDVEGVSYFPLRVDYEEKHYAAGEIYGSRYFKREGRPTTQAILTSRLIDRTIRPRFNHRLRRSIQVIITVLSWDGINDPEIPSLIAASTALSISDIPWSGPVAGIRIGKIGKEFILNPTYEQRTESELDLILGAVRPDKELLINMIESKSEEVKENDIVKGVEFAKSTLKDLINFQEKITKKIGEEKKSIKPPRYPEIGKEIDKWAGDRIKKALFQPQNPDRMDEVNELKNELEEFLKEKYEEEPQKIEFGLNFFEEKIDNLVHQAVLEEQKRPDGRGLKEVRELHTRAGLIPRAHGSGLFIRGRTKSLSILTLGGPEDQQLLEGMEIVGKKRFMHHYNFPPYSVGETQPIRGPGRREIGHGMLVERALLPLIPNSEEFPYTIRVVSEILSSNGSTSMASISSSCLSLMDSGVPIKAPAAGIAMGLMKKGDDYEILTDIQGPEDHHGDMDLKVAGTQNGITAIQMDVKISGINQEILEEGLSRAKEARLKILDKMKESLSEPRKKLSKWAPRIYTLQINPEKIGDLIGPQGKTINKITDECEVSIDIQEDGKVFVTSRKEEEAKKAVNWIKNITREVKSGEVFQGKVTRLLDFGAFVEILPGQEGLIHVSKFPGRKIKLKPGDKVTVKVDEIDSQGRINLSLAKK